jgi:hypothetical protein
MNKILAVALLCISGAALANPPATLTQSQGQSTTTQSQSQASNAGNNQDIQVITEAPGTVHTTTDGSQSVKNVPNVNAPALTTSNDTCMGSTSGGVSILGLGITAGTTWTDGNCKRLKNSRELWNMGMRAASLAILCNDSEDRAALEDTGYVCPEHKKRDQTKGDAVNTPQ